MSSASPTSATPWERLEDQAVATLLSATTVRWWLSGGAALDRWLGRPIRPRRNTDVSVVAADLLALIASLPQGFSAWVPVDTEDGGGLGDSTVPYGTVPADADLHHVLIHDDAVGAWVLQVNVEDGTRGPSGDAGRWVYKRDPRLQLPWDRAVVDLAGIPTGAPEVQLVWKALRPRPEDDLDKDAVVPELSDEARAWYERSILSIHPHSSWSIHVRSPFAPAKASWNRKKS